MKKVFTILFTGDDDFEGDVKVFATLEKAKEALKGYVEEATNEELGDWVEEVEWSSDDKEVHLYGAYEDWVWARIIEKEIN